MKDLYTALAIISTGLAISASIFMASTRFNEMSPNVDYDNAVNLTKMILEADDVKTKNLNERIDLHVSTYEKVLNKLKPIE